MTKFLYIMLAIGLLLVGCKDDDSNDLNTEQLNTQKLTKTWDVGSDGYVLVDGQDITSQFAGFSITFESNEGSKVFFVTNGQSAFSTEVDTWAFADDTYASIIRGSDGVVMDISVNEDFLTLTFSIPMPSNGRGEGAFGDFEFKLETQN